MPPNPRVLTFDTSGSHCIAAVATHDGVRIRVEQMQKGQAERLTVLLQELLDECGVGFGDINALGVGVGPGNFTGIRISVSMARGLALGLGIPAIGINGFEIVTEGAPGPAQVPGPRQMCYVQRPGCAHALLPQSEAKGIPSLADISLEDQMTRMAHLTAIRLPAYIGQRPVPLYIRPADAAPARNAPPKILA